MAKRLLHHCAVVRGQWRGGIATLVGDSQPAAQIQTTDGMPVGAQLLCQFGNLLVRQFERRQIGQLASDVHIDAHDL